MNIHMQLSCLHGKDDCMLQGNRHQQLLHVSHSPNIPAKPLLKSHTAAPQEIEHPQNSVTSSLANSGLSTGHSTGRGPQAQPYQLCKARTALRAKGGSLGTRATCCCSTTVWGSHGNLGSAVR